MSRKTNNAKSIARLATRGFAVLTVLRQARKAREDGDALRLLDAIVNALAILTAVAIIVRELREMRGDAEAAVDRASL